MRVLIRNIPSGQYYAGGNNWAVQSESGFDFETTTRALKWIDSVKMGEVEIIYSYGNQYDIVVPPHESPAEDLGL